MDTAAARPRVTYVTCYPAGISRGGLEIQVERSAKAMQTLGQVSVERFTPDTQDFGDLVHFFGTYDYFWDIAEHCVRMHIPYVCSPVYLTEKRGALLKWRAIRKKYLEKSYPKKLKHLYSNAVRLFTNTAAEERNLRTYFGSHLPPMVRTPNGIEERFFTATPDLFVKETGIDRPFVLHSGSIEPRKNQLRMITAVQDLDIDAVLIGREPDTAYLNLCRAASGPNIHFLGELQRDSPLIPSMNAAASVFCLPSFAEVLSLSSFEAAATGAPVIVGNTWGAEEYFGDYARYVNPSSVSSIRDAIRASRNEPARREERREHFAQRYSWEAVARLFTQHYLDVLNGT